MVLPVIMLYEVSIWIFSWCAEGGRKKLKKMVLPALIEDEKGSYPVFSGEKRYTIS